MFTFVQNFSPELLTLAKPESSGRGTFGLSVP